MYVCESASTAYNARLQVPERSTFYSSEALEVAPGMIEGFSRYIGRLAALHDFRVTDLICHSSFDPLFPVGVSLRDRRRGFLAYCHLLDGTHAYTPRWMSVIQAITCQTNLGSTSLLPYANICDGSWMRRTRLWCPFCLKSCAYEPLLWSIRAVVACPVHGVRLVDRCHHCARTNLPLAAYYAPGECVWCRGSLTGSGYGFDELRATEYELWVANEARDLIIRMKHLEAPLPRSCFMRALSRLLSTMGESTQTALAGALGCTRRSMALWASGHALPRVQTLFGICFHIRISVWTLLAESDLPRQSQFFSERTSCERSISGNNPAAASPTDVAPNAGSDLSVGSAMHRTRATHEDRLRLESIMRAAIDAGVVDSPRKIAKAAGYTSPDRLLAQISSTATLMRTALYRQREARLNEMEQALQQGIVAMPPPTLRQVASSLAITSSTTLIRSLPQLCEQLVVKRRSWVSAQREHAADVLLAALDQDKLLSFTQLCKTQGLSASHVTASFPGIKAEYQAKHRAQLQTERRMAEMRFQSETAVAVGAVLGRGRYPSVGRVTGENSSLKSRGWHHMVKAIDSAIKAMDRRPNLEFGSDASANCRGTAAQSVDVAK
jgi:hypothetical protein